MCKTKTTEPGYVPRRPGKESLPARASLGHLALNTFKNHRLRSGPWCYLFELCVSLVFRARKQPTSRADSPASSPFRPSSEARALHGAAELLCDLIGLRRKQRGPGRCLNSCKPGHPAPDKEVPRTKETNKITSSFSNSSQNNMSA